MKISICMMVKDEEKNLKRCIESLKPLINSRQAELIIVDTGSSDSTVDISKEYTNNIYFHPWNNDFSDMRNKTISYAKGEWILIVDADEELVNSDELLELIDSKKIKSYSTIVFQVKSFNDLNNKEVVAINPSPRLFKNDGEFKYIGAVHNQPVFKQPIKVTNIVLNHYGYIMDDKELMEKKFVRTKSILEKELSQNPENDYYRFQLGVAFDMHGNKKEAYEEFKKAYSMMKDKSYDYKKNRIYIFSAFARSASLNKIYEEVIDVCKEGLNLRKDFIDLYYILAVTERVIGRYNESILNLITYINLIANFESLEIAKDLTVSFYNMDKASMESAYVNLYLNSFDICNYEKAKEYIPYIKDQTKKMYCYSRLIPYIEAKEEILAFYNDIDSNYKIKFSEIIEKEINELSNQEQTIVRNIFSKIDDQYGIYNKIMIENNNKRVNDLTLEFIDKISINQCPNYFGNLIYITLKQHENVYSILLNVSDKHIERFFNYCNDKFDDMSKIIEEYLNSKMSIDHSFNTLRINKILLRNIMLFNITKEPLKVIFYKYLDTGIKYLQMIYRNEIIEDEMVYNVEEENAFLIFMHKAQKIKETDLKEYVKYLKKALITYPYFKDYIELLNKELENEICEKNNKFDQYKNEVKSTIKTLIDSNNIDEAKAISTEYKKIVSDDIEIYSMDAVILIMEGKYIDAGNILKEGLKKDCNNFDLNYNLGYLCEIQSKLEEAIKYYAHAYNKAFNTEVKDQIKNLIKKLLYDSKKSESFDEILRQSGSKQTCLILCSFYSVFTKQFIENMKKNKEITFDVLTMDTTYIMEKESGNINNVYVYKDINELNKIFNTLTKYNIMHIHFLNPFYYLLTERMKSNCDKLVVSIWGSDYYRITEEDSELQKQVLDIADVITIANKQTILDFNKNFKNKYVTKIHNCRFGLKPLEYIENINSINKDDIKEQFSIPKDSIVVTCGYSASRAHNHLQIIDSICKTSNVLSKDIFFVVPMTYGGDLDYIEEVRMSLKRNKFRYIIFDKFLENKEIAKIRKVSDIMIQLQNTDQLSGSMQEHLYSSNIVITGKWLPYKMLKDKGCFLLDVARIQDVGEKLLYAINNFKKLKNRCINNKKIIGDLSLWVNTINDWIESYEQDN